MSARLHPPRRPHLPKAGATVHRPILPRQERDLCRGATAGTHGLIHGAGGASCGRSPCLSTLRTPLGVLIAPTGVELLVVSGEDEGPTAFNAY